MAEPSRKRQKLHGRAFYESLGSPKLILAPMVDQSEYAWRLLSRSFLPPEQRTGLLAYSPMLHARMFADGWKYRDSHFECRKEGWEAIQVRNKDAVENGSEGMADEDNQAADHLDGNVTSDRPLFVQFCANDPQALLSAAKLVQPYCDAVDLNLGCPQGIAKRGRYGAFLQEDPSLIARMIRRLHEDLDIPVTAKMRILETREKTLGYAKTLLDAGASILTVHGRRREMKGHATGVADWDMIRYLRDSLPKETVLFANGNILQHNDIQKCLDATGVDGVMSAEGNLYDPSIFAGPPPQAASSWVDVEREYWVGRDGMGGYRVDAVLRRYLDIIYEHALDRESPHRMQLFVTSDIPDEKQKENPTQLVDGANGCDHTSSAKRSRTADKISGHDETSTVAGNGGERPEEISIKRQKLYVSSAGEVVVSRVPNPAQPATDSVLDGTLSQTPQLKLSKKQRKAMLKKAAKQNTEGLRSKPVLEKPNSPNIVAMQAHCFHILRPLVSVHHNVRDALARSRAGDIAAYETVLALTEEAVKQGLLAYERDPTAFEDKMANDEASEQDVTRSSTAAVRRCKRPFWICQAYVRPLPHEALEKGSLQLSKKDIKKMETMRADAVEDTKNASAEVNVEAVRAGVAPEGRLVAVVPEGNSNHEVLVEGEGMVAG